MTNSRYNDTSDGSFTINAPTPVPTPTPTPTPPNNRKCSNDAKFVIPHDGNMGWPYMDDYQHVIDHDGTIHRGIDIFAKPGDRTVYAPYDGKVVAAPSYFRIRHPDLGVDTYYGYVIGTVPIGKDVKQGDPIGMIRYDSDHVHFAITYSPPHDTNELIFANSIDPSPYFNAQLNFFDGTPESVDSNGKYNRTVKSWCNKAPVGIIQGLVKTPDGKVVSDARAEIEGTTQYRITDYWMNINQGRYTFSNAPVGEVTITASKDGLSGSVKVNVKSTKEDEDGITAPDIILR